MKNIKDLIKIKLSKDQVEKAIVYWNVLIKKNDLKNIKINKNFYRTMIVNNKIYNFEKFNDLHPLNYKAIIKEKKFNIIEFKKTINLLHKLK